MYSRFLTTALCAANDWSMMMAEGFRLGGGPETCPAPGRLAGTEMGRLYTWVSVSGGRGQ